MFHLFAKILVFSYNYGHTCKFIPFKKYMFLKKYLKYIGNILDQQYFDISPHVFLKKIGDTFFVSI